MPADSSHASRACTISAGLLRAYAPMSVSLTLEDEIDISRGDMIVSKTTRPRAASRLRRCSSGLVGRQLGRARSLYHRHTTNEAKCLLKEMKYKVDINTLHKIEDDREVRLNDIARVSLQTSAPIHFDRYRRNRATGSFVLVDEQSNNTVAAGMIVG